MKHTLEQYKIFPYIAWATVFVAAFCLYKLATNVGDQMAELEQSKHNVIRAVDRDLRSGHIEY